MCGLIKTGMHGKPPLVSQAIIMQNHDMLAMMIPELRNAVQGRKKSHSKVAKSAAEVYFKQAAHPSQQPKRGGNVTEPTMKESSKLKEPMKEPETET